MALRNFFSDSRISFNLLTNRERNVVMQLWQAGLLLAGGQPNPETIPTNDKYPSSLLLKLTGACNIECEYCYDYDSSRFKKRLPLGRITETIAHLLAKRDKLSILFHGGEPLLNFNVIKEVVTHAISESGARDRLHFGIQTNGTLFTEEIVAFLRNNNFSVGLSLDSNVEDGNRLRVSRGEISVLTRIKSVMSKYPGFLQERAGVLAVVSKSSLPHLTSFMRWLQEYDISAFSVSFLDLAGRAAALTDEKPTTEDAIEFYSSVTEMIRKREIQKLNFKSLNSHVSNFFTFSPRDFCHKGPCGAASGFLVLDAEGTTRTCDCVYDPFFVISESNTVDLDSSIRGVASRNRVVDRHNWLRDSGPLCSQCSLFGLCGGTCAAKAIASNGHAESISALECGISKYLYPLILEEFSSGHTPLVDYFHFHRSGPE